MDFQLIGYVNLFRVKPNFVLPVFSKPGDKFAFWYQVLNQNKSIVVRYEQLDLKGTRLLSEFEFCGDLSSSTPIMGFDDGNTVKIGPLENLREYFVSSNFSEKFNLGLTFQISEVIEDEIQNDLHGAEFIKKLSSIGQEAQAKKFLVSCLTVAGWKEIETRYFSEAGNSLEFAQMRHLLFSLEGNCEVTFRDTGSGIGLTEDEVLPILSALSQRLRTSIEEMKHCKPSPEFHNSLEDMDVEIWQHFNQVLRCFSRQEERLAFQIRSFLTFKSNASTILKYRDAAKSASMGSDVLRRFSDSRDYLKTPISDHEIISVLNEIYDHWKSGNKEVFLEFLVKWLSDFPDLVNKFFLNRRADIGEYYYVFLTTLLQSVRKNKRGYINVLELFSGDLEDVQATVHKFSNSFTRTKQKAFSKFVDKIK